MKFTQIKLKIQVRTSDQRPFHTDKVSIISNYQFPEDYVIRKICKGSRLMLAIFSFAKFIWLMLHHKKTLFAAYNYFQTVEIKKFYFGVCLLRNNYLIFHELINMVYWMFSCIEQYIKIINVFITYTFSCNSF